MKISWLAILFLDTHGGKTGKIICFLQDGMMDIHISNKLFVLNRLIKGTINYV